MFWVDNPGPWKKCPEKSLSESMVEVLRGGELCHQSRNHVRPLLGEIELTYPGDGIGQNCPELTALAVNHAICCRAALITN